MERTTLLLNRCCAKADNPTSIIPPYQGPDPGYIVAESTSGLANRLRVMAAYMYVAEHKYEGAHLVFIWEKNEACPGHFLSVFEPIDGVIFANNISRYVLDKHAKINYENSFAVFNWIMRMNNIPRNRFGLPSWAEIEYRMHSRYRPVREVMYKALSFVERYNICSSSAMHIRETDLAQHLVRQSGGRRRPSLQPFIHFVESRPLDEPVFLLTDNPITQDYFLQTFGESKILVYERMNASINRLPLVLRSSKDLLHNSSHNSSIAEDHRYTTLENTVIDVIIAAHAKNFKASPFSSLSELVTLFSRIGKQEQGWCSNG
eukprot:gene8201-9048_t